METGTTTIEARQVDVTAALNRGSQSTDKVVLDHVPWLAEARKLRDEALRLMQARFAKDLEDVTQLVGCDDPSIFPLQIEYADKVTADYLAASERMFDLMRKSAEEAC